MSMELPKPVKEKQKPRREEATTGALPKNGVDATAAAMGQWAGGPPNDRSRVVVEEGPVEARRNARPETVTTTPVARSTDVEREEGPRSADKTERGTPVFEDMDEPTVEIVMWTTTREEALKKVTKESMVEEGEFSPQVLDSNRQKYKEMMSSLTVRDATE